MSGAVTAQLSLAVTVNCFEDTSKFSSRIYMQDQRRHRPSNCFRLLVSTFPPKQSLISQTRTVGCFFATYLNGITLASRTLS